MISSASTRLKPESAEEWPFPAAAPLLLPVSAPWPFPLPLSQPPPLPSACSDENRGPVTLLTTPLSRSRTSADAVGLRASLPLKITSSIRSPRRLFALCSPITHVMASATLLLPHPLGPTIAVTLLSKASSDRSENDLKP